jgi:glyoxylase-like metal-dependent hydrolase (beta-lactamase superfamily II)
VPALAHAAASLAQPAQTSFTDLRRGVGVFAGNGGSIGYLVNADGAMAVDSQFMDTAALCVAGLKERSPKGVSLLINTHHHGDHTGGNAAFRSSVQRIVQHANCDSWQRRVAERANTTATQAFADVTFTDTWNESFGNEQVTARHYGAGHTSGDVTVTFEQANIVHMGDLFFNRAHPNIDRAAGASIGSWITALEQVTGAASSDTRFIAGHAKDGVVSTTRTDVLHFRDYLSASLNRATRAVQAGETREQLAAITSLPGFEDFTQLNARLSQGFVLGIAYDEVTNAS